MTGLLSSDLRMEGTCASCRSVAVCIDAPICRELAAGNMLDGNCRNVMLPAEYPGLQLLAICPILCHVCIASTERNVMLDSCAPPGAPVIKLGGLFPLDEIAVGSWATLGLELQSSFLFACARVNSDCALLPGVQLDCGSRDTSFDEAVAVASARKFVRLGPQLVGVVGAVSSSISMAVASQVFGPDGIPDGTGITQISPSSTAPELSDTAQYPYFFRTCASDVFQAQALRDVVAALGLVSVATIATTDAYASSLVEAFEADMRGLGVSILASERFVENAAASDVGPSVAALLSAGARTILVSAVGHDTLTVLQAMLRRGMVGPQYVIIGTDGFTSITRRMLQAQPDRLALHPVLDGMLGVRPRAASGALWEAFLADWHAVGADRFGTSNIHAGELGQLEAGVYAAETADAVYAYAHALQSMAANGIDIAADSRARMREFLRAVDFEGMTGRVRFTAAGDRSPGYEIVDWTGGVPSHGR